MAFLSPDDLHTGRLLRRIPSPDDTAVSSIAVSSDGKLFKGVGSFFKLGFLYDIQRETELKRMIQNDRSGQSAIFTNDGRLISINAMSEIVIWDTQNLEIIHKLKGHDSYVKTIALTPDGKIASGDTGQVIKVWDLESGQSLKTLDGNQGEIISLVSAGNHAVISASRDRLIKLWDLNSGQSWNLLRHPHIITAMAYSTSSHKLVFADTTGRIYFYDMIKIVNEQGNIADPFEGIPTKHHQFRSAATPPPPSSAEVLAANANIPWISTRFTEILRTACFLGDVIIIPVILGIQFKSLLAGLGASAMSALILWATQKNAVAQRDKWFRIKIPWYIIIPMFMWAVAGWTLTMTAPKSQQPLVWIPISFFIISLLLHVINFTNIQAQARKRDRLEASQWQNSTAQPGPAPNRSIPSSTEVIEQTELIRPTEEILPVTKPKISSSSPGLDLEGSLSTNGLTDDTQISRPIPLAQPAAVKTSAPVQSPITAQMDKAPLPRFAWLMALYFRLIMVIDILVIPSTIAQQTHSSGSFWIGLVVGFILFWGYVFGHFRLFFAIMGLAWAWFGGIIAMNSGNAHLVWWFRMGGLLVGWGLTC